MNHPYSAPKGAVRRLLHTGTLAGLLLATSTGLQAQNASYALDNIPLAGGAFNTGFGIGVLTPVSGNNNTALGYRASTANGTGSDNTAVGYFSLATNATGTSNTAVGAQALELGAAPSFTTAIGAQCLRFATGNGQNTATGYQAMNATTTGGRNVAFGMRALAASTVGSSNAAFGAFALTSATGNGNTGIGRDALVGTTTGSGNSAVGFSALVTNTTGGGNTAVGQGALSVNTVGSTLTSIGISSNVSVNNLTNATALGANTIVNASNKVRLGNAAVTVVEGPVAYTFSDGRFKTNVRAEDVVGLDFIQRLRPVVYNLDTRGITAHWTQGMDAEQRAAYLADDFGPSTAIRQSGFIAQEVEQAAREVGYDFNGVHVPADAGDNYSVAYGQFVVPLVKAVQEQQAMIATQAEQMALQQKELAELKSLVRTLAQAGEGDASKQAHAVEVFPNPSQGRFTVRIAPLEQGHWEVYDQQGKQVHFRAVTPGQSEYSLDLSGLASGSYLLRLHSPGGLVATKQLVVK